MIIAGESTIDWLATPTVITTHVWPAACRVVTRTIKMSANGSSRSAKICTCRLTCYVLAFYRYTCTDCHRACAPTLVQICTSDNL